MAERKTEDIRNKIGKSIGGGMSSILGKSGRTYCIIQYQSNTEKHRLGENQEVIVDYAELGRDQKCVVRFGEDCRMVSRIHAAIFRENNDWMISHKGSNETLVNGRPVNHKWFLKNGDIIQLASNGPKLGFIIPQNPAVASIGLSRRLSLFRQQALRPYRTAIIVLTAILLMAVGTLGFFLYRTTSQLDLTNQKLAEARQISAEQAAANTRRTDSLGRENVALKQKMGQIVRRIDNISVPDFSSTGTSSGTAPGQLPPSAIASSLAGLYKNVFAILGVKLAVTFNGETQTTEFPVQGTGFLLNDGRFVTARHVINPWLFINPVEPDEDMALINIIDNSGGTVEFTMTAISPDGTKLTLKSTDFRVDDQGDQIKEIEGPDGVMYNISIAGFDDGKDWAVTKPGRTGIIKSNAQLSNSLPPLEKLYVLGYPMGVGIDGQNDITPQLTTVEVTQAGTRNVIRITGAIDHGNSGGPVFVLQGGEPIAVGIVSSGLGDAMKFLVPISAVPN